MAFPSQTKLDETAVENFREYLRIPSVHPDVDYGKISHVFKQFFNGFWRVKTIDLAVRFSTIF